MLAHADLARYTGQFVWLELNFDNGANREFLDTYGAIGTPTFYILDPQDGKVAAVESGAMSYDELVSFLERGARGASAKKLAPADTALKRGDELLPQKPAKAVAAYREALRIAPPDWRQHDLAEASLVAALQSNNENLECAQTAAAEAMRMPRGPTFARTVVSGLWCLVSDSRAPSAKELAPKLEALAQDALSLSTTVRDHRDEIYRTLMMMAVSRDDNVSAAKWGDR
jgi:hypothetical protein